MYREMALADEILQSAAMAVKFPSEGVRHGLDVLPAPLYLTDASGSVTYFNLACVGFAGRTPEIGKDRWCVTWKLYTDDGEPLPHNECPMATALLEKRPVRGVTAQAERPDGARVRFLPLPTPLFDDDGELLGGVNMLIDITDLRQIEDLKAQAVRCRRLAEDTNDKRTVATLKLMADEYEVKAGTLERARG